MWIISTPDYDTLDYDLGFTVLARYEVFVAGMPNVFDTASGLCDPRDGQTAEEAIAECRALRTEWGREEPYNNGVLVYLKGDRLVAQFEYVE